MKPKSAEKSFKTGTPTLAGIGHDVAELRNAANQINQLETTLTEILDTLPSIIATVDAGGRVLIVNKRFAEFSGLSAASAAGMLLESLIPQFTSQVSLVQEVIANRLPAEFESVQYRIGAELRYYSIGIYPLRSDSSEMAVVRINDVTDHIRMDEVMFQAEKITMVSSLAAGMAHEINNPLGAIMQHAQNIERRVSPDIAANLAAAESVGVSLEKVRAYLQKRGIFEFITHIRAAGGRASAIISNILELSSRNGPEVEMVDLSRLLDHTVELAASDYDMKKHYGFRGIEIVRQYQDEPLMLDLVIQDMEQVFLNIIKNAAQALAATAVPLASPRITLRTGVTDGFVTAAIEDNGPGMDESTRLKVFNPFFSTRAVGDGSGLGLSVAYAIVTKGHHGTIDVQSQPGVGSCFTVKVPLKRRDS